MKRKLAKRLLNTLDELGDLTDAALEMLNRLKPADPTPLPAETVKAITRPADPELMRQLAVCRQALQACDEYLSGVNCDPQRAREAVAAALDGGDPKVKVPTHWHIPGDDSRLTKEGDDGKDVQASNGGRNNDA